MTQDFVTDVAQWLGADDAVLVGMASLLVAMVWFSEKIRVDRSRSERGLGRVRLSSRAALNDSSA